MDLLNNEKRYGSLSIGLHWLMLLLVVAAYATIELREFFPKGSDPREALKMWHFMIGLSVLLLVVVRLALRLARPTPRIEPALPKWQKILADLMQVLLYLFMFSMPILGWLVLSGEGKPNPFFGLQLPALIGANKDAAILYQEVHETIGTIGYFLVGFHAAAALFHHYFVRDNTLKRMLPGRD
jgi:cytochrome b561